MSTPSSPVFSTKLAPYTVSFIQAEEFHRLKKEIFSQHVYYFETNAEKPKIIDAGAHIGLSTLYFKKLFPAAEVIAIEPLPQNLQLLEQNIWQNRLENVEVLPAALWPSGTEIPFYYDQEATNWFSTASTFPQAWNQQQKTTSLSVQTIPLSYLLTGPVDFLKLDIEGAEQEVLEEAADQLPLIKEMIIEFHPVATQSLSDLLELLESKRFAIDLWKDGLEVKPNRARGLVYIHAKQKR